MDRDWVEWVRDGDLRERELVVAPGADFEAVVQAAWLSPTTAASGCESNDVAQARGLATIRRIISERSLGGQLKTGNLSTGQNRHFRRRRPRPEQRHRSQIGEVPLPGAIERGIGELLEERVGLAIEDAIALLDDRAADGLGQMGSKRWGVL